MSGVILLRPLWLLAIPAVAALAFWILRRRSALASWHGAIDPALMQAMAAMGRVRTLKRPPMVILPGMAAAGIALALSGPAMERRDVSAFRNLDGVILVMDASRSVTEAERWNDTITAARIILQSIGSKPAGLIVYAGDAYVASAMTSDTRTLELTVASVTDETVPDTGTRPALALARAKEMLTEAQILAGDVILLSDGAGLSSDSHALAREIREMGSRVSVLRVQGVEGVQDAALETLAGLGGGWAADPDGAQELGRRIAGGSAERLAALDYLLMIRADYGRYLLILAMLPVLLLLRGREV